MARLYLSPERIQSPPVLLTGEEYRYLCKVLRLREGDRIVVFDGQGQECDATLGRIGPRAAELHLAERRAIPIASGPVLTLLVGLPKGDKMDLIVQKATELGAARIVPVLSARSIPQVEALRATTRRHRWIKIAREAARQCGRADVPEVGAPTAFRNALALAEDSALRLLFWEDGRAERLRRHLPAEPPREIFAVVGPEGGFTTEEVEAARTAGFAIVGLGPRILRAETAAVVAVTVLEFALGDLG